MPLIQTPGSSRRGGCSPVAGESVHSDAGNNQINFERRGGDRCGSVDHERIRTLSVPFPDPRRNMKHGVRESS